MAATTLIDRAVLRLSGPDVRGFLQGLVTNDVTGPLPVWAGLLSAQGKALFDFFIWAERPGEDPATGSGEPLLIDCEAAQADALARRLTLYRLRRPIAIARDEALAVHWSPEPGVGVPDPRLAALGHRWLAPPGEAAEGWRAHRLSLGVCEGAGELGQDRTLWLETNAAELNGVSFTKGCYVGQENTARMNWRATVSRRLVAVRNDEPPSGQPAAWYPELGLAVERRRVEAIGADASIVAPEWLVRALDA